jgi:hypothetical protein
MTPFITATATDRDVDLTALPWGWLVLGLILWGLAYLAQCAWWPFAHCRRCEGRGRHSRKDGKVWRRCRRCKGSGARLRLGRRVWNRFAKVRKNAT